MTKPVLKIKKETVIKAIEVIGWAYLPMMPIYQGEPPVFPKQVLAK